ncbi:hypothetical protein CYMTET_40259 [Cymbomonas tetramitiformis]|uniref:Uncharacterized protein n=1 Tax=Cymbomonas tetramitiformis TaxID=36881 RepID=A0AAE0C8H2_9CHLO|nr:hypothetical protein CYMTET_40259 [Cymbomonas tetramitiformis]
MHTIIKTIFAAGLPTFAELEDSMSAVLPALEAGCGGGEYGYGATCPLCNAATLLLVEVLVFALPFWRAGVDALGVALAELREWLRREPAKVRGTRKDLKT